MASNLRVDSIVPSTGANVSIGTATGGVTIPGDLGIAGVLTYEDVTNIDSVGVITARDGLRVTGVTTITGTGEYLLKLNKSDSSAVYTQFTNSTTGTSTSDGFRIGMDSNEDGLVWLREDGNVKFGTNNSERLRIDTSGNVTANTGNIIIGTAGKGIDYSAQSGAAAGMASELLDHYEEGTFTPTFGASNGTSTTAYSTQSGKYTRIGNIVHVQIRITLSSLSTGVHSHAWISGLPIASAERTATSAIVCGGMQGSGYNSFPIVGRTEANATRIELFAATNGGVTDFSTSVVNGTAYFIVQCTYRAA